MSLFYRLTRLALKAYFHLFYRYRVYGPNQLLVGKAILAANHASFLDPPVIATSWREELHFLARASLFHSKIGAWVLSHLNAHPVRGNAQDLDSLRLICELLKEGKKVVVFPEGERSGTGRLQSMKMGIAMLAIRMQCPIIPVYIGGTFESWSRYQKWPTIGNSIQCVFGDPIYPTFIPETNKKEMQEIMTKQVQDSLEQLRIWLESESCR